LPQLHVSGGAWRGGDRGGDRGEWRRDAPRDSPRDDRGPRDDRRGAPPPARGDEGGWRRGQFATLDLELSFILGLLFHFATDNELLY